MHKNYIHAIDYICWTQMGKKSSQVEDGKKRKDEVDGGLKRKAENGKKTNSNENYCSKRVNEWASWHCKQTNARGWGNKAKHTLTRELKKMFKKRKMSEKPYVFIITIIIFPCAFFSLYMCRFDAARLHIYLWSLVWAPHTCSLSLSSIAASTMHPAYGKHTQYIYEINSKYKEEHTTM